LTLATGVALPQGAAPTQLARAQADPAAQVDACMRSEMAGSNVHGAQIAVMREGEMVFERAYGRKHRDRPDLVGLHTQFRIGSTTKAFTAFAVMQQADLGKVDLDAPITRYLGGFTLAEPGQAEAITLRHLLTHASGLHDTSAFDESDLFGPTDPGAMGRWVDAQRGQAPYAPPGRFWNYSSANYMYAGHILERLSGLSYPDYMDQRVFAPLGLADTTLHAEAAVARGDFAYGHYNNPFSGRLEIYDLNQANNWARHPTGYINSTAGDLARFASALMAGGNGALSPASVAAMQTRQQHRDLRADQYYGLGTFVEYFQGNEMVHHDGGAWGWSATLKWIPSAGVAVATTSNTTHLMSGATSCALTAYVPSRPSPSPPCRLDPRDWDKLVGTYRGSLNTGTAWTLQVTRSSADGNLRLRLERAGQADSEYDLTQDCGLWLGSGPGSFQAGGLGLITFIADPIEPGLTWLRNRFFVAARRAEVAPSPTPTAPAASPTPTHTPIASATHAPAPGAPTATTPAPTAFAVHLPWLRR
jgi:CubicO group peptidase (beta-lactamase class C family)